MSSLDDYIVNPKRVRTSDDVFELNESFRKQPTDERISILFKYLQDTKPEYAPLLCHELVEHGRKKDLRRLLELVPIEFQQEVYDHMFRALWREEGSLYSTALKELTNIAGELGNPSIKCIDFIAHKIVAPENDDMSAFLDELQLFYKLGYKFNPTMLNRLMDYNLKKIDFKFQKFVLGIINKLSRDELDSVNDTILNKFVTRHVHCIKKPRLGLSRKI